MFDRLRDVTRSTREYGRALIGRGRTALDDVFQVLEALYLSDDGQARRLRGFWGAADAIEVLPNRRLIARSPEIVAYCTREALGEIGKAASDGSGGRWRQLSREVVAASHRYQIARELPGGDEAEALDDLLSAIADLDEFHTSEVDANAKALHSLVFQVTGARLVGPDDAARQFSRLLRQLNEVAHGSGSWDEVAAMRSNATTLLRRLFSSPDDHLDALDRLARVEEPALEDVAMLEASVTNQHHVRYFLERIPTCVWLERLGTHEMFAPPVHDGEAWPIGFVARRLGTACPREMTKWLTNASQTWGDDPARAAHIAAAAVAVGAAAHGLLLSLLRRHPADERMMNRPGSDGDSGYWFPTPTGVVC